MPRIRYIKPDFFKDEDVATLPYELRLLFAGLWCWADREGRLEYRIKFLKAEIFPYDNIDMEAAIKALEVPHIPERPEKSFIKIYTVSGKKYIQIQEFNKHQKPHKTEKASDLPPFNGELTVKQPLNNRLFTESENLDDNLLDDNELSALTVKQPLLNGYKTKISVPNGEGDGEGNGEGNGDGDGEPKSKKIEFFKKSFIEDQITIERTCIQHRIDEEKLLKGLESFLEIKQSTKKNDWENESDFRSNFIFWIPSWLEREKKEIKKLGLSPKRKVDLDP